MEASGSDTAERAALAAGEREANGRDTTDEWRIGPAKAPATVAELEARIDVALVTAQSAEEAALEIGAASLEAAEQARRAAALAERASAAAARSASDASSAAGDAARAASGAASAAESAARTREAIPSASSTSVGTAPRGAGRAATAPASTDFLPRPNGADPRRPDPFEERIAAFRLRAEKVMIRLRKLEAGAGPSGVLRLG